MNNANKKWLCPIGAVLCGLMLIGINIPYITMRAQTGDNPVTGRSGTPAEQTDLSVATLQSASIVGVTPADPPSVENCIPFGDNTTFGFTGFIYRDFPAFTLVPGDKIRFDLGALNDVDIHRNIYFAVANKNPDPCIVTGLNVVSQGVKALSWTKVVSDTQVPVNPRGNTIVGDYELTYTAEAPFTFSGGGFIVGFSGSPPAGFPDSTCDQVLVATNCSDSSGEFYARFFLKSEQTLDVLDILTGGEGNAVALGGILLETGLGFDVCLQDDSTQDIFQFSSETGDYRFTRCRGSLVVSGTGTLIRKGNLFTLQHNSADRRVLAKIDTSVNKGTASIQVFSLGTTFTIMDRNTINNSCACP